MAIDEKITLFFSTKIGPYLSESHWERLSWFIVGSGCPYLFRD